MTPAERASAFKARWWAISHGWSAQLDEADLREAFAAAEASALERAAQAFDDRGPKLLSGYETARLLRYPYVPSPAAALRAVEAETLERAAQALDSHRYINASKIVRALASPAAAPAAKVCRAEVASRMPDYSHYECTLPKGHTGAHREGSFAEWTDATTVVAPPSEPAAPAPDLRTLLAKMINHMKAWAASEDGRISLLFVDDFLAAQRAVSTPASTQGAEAPDPERDRNRHNAMLVEAWRGEFGALCNALFPGDDGPIGWKHIHAKIAELLAARAKAEDPAR